MPSEKRADPADEKAPVLYTIGHSNRELAAFLAMLQAHGIGAVADVRSMPGSRRLPQFNAESLVQSLSEAGIQYWPCKELGGRRKPSADSRNIGWHHPAFRAYADYMETPEFRIGLEQLLARACHIPTAIMCAEAVPWRCHRNMVADAAVLLMYWEVRHIMTDKKADPHKPAAFARVEGDHLFYPAPDDLLSP